MLPAVWKKNEFVGKKIGGRPSEHRRAQDWNEQTMTESIKSEIERLLDEPGGLPATDRASDLLRSRLTATLSEGLGDASVAPSQFSTRDLASMAAFIDGQLTGAARDKFAADLSQQQSLRADLESTAALVYATSDSPLEVPKHLLARAGAQFAPAPPPALESRWRLDLSMLLPRRRIAWAMVAALALIVATPAGLMLSGRYGGPQGGGEPELSAVPEPAGDASQRQKSCEDKLNELAKAGKLKKAPERAADASEPKDPCARLARELDGSSK
jgi:hypothetical protein